MKKNNYKDYTVAALGLILLVCGLVIIKKVSEPQGIMRALPYIFIGIGCGVFGHGMGEIISYRVVKNNPDILKQIEIEKKDERNIKISNHAKAKAYDMMIYVFGALMVCFALMGVEFVEVILLVCAYLFVIFYGVYCRYRYNKEM